MSLIDSEILTGLEWADSGEFEAIEKASMRHGSIDEAILPPTDDVGTVVLLTNPEAPNPWGSNRAPRPVAGVTRKDMLLEALELLISKRAREVAAWEGSNREELDGLILACVAYDRRRTAIQEG